jgi:poly-beta-1,6 N-acetyl-D-glucosamine synthase
MNWFFPYLFATYLLLFIAILKSALFVYLSSRQCKHFKDDLSRQSLSNLSVLVSVIVPAYNEELVLKNCVTSLLKQNYYNIEIVIVDDGSTDGTASVGQWLANEYRKVFYCRKANGGKAAALNYGIRRSKGSLIVCMDSDSMFLEDTVKNIVLSFKDPSVMAVAGNVRIANRYSLLGKEQAAEYMSGLTLQRQSFCALNCIQVMSGALASFRRTTIEKVGYYSTDTLVEDMDITMACAVHDQKVVYNPLAIAYTEGPSSWGDLVKQRQRWVYGGFQVVKKYWYILGKKKFGNMGIIGFPYFVVFPWVDVFASLLLVVAVIQAVYFDALVSFFQVLILMLGVQAGIIALACYLDNEDYSLILYSILGVFFYSHLLNYVTVRAGVTYLLKNEVRWDKLKRIGANTHHIGDLSSAQ